MENDRPRHVLLQLLVDLPDQFLPFVGVGLGGLLVEGDIATQARRAFDNLKAVCEAAGGSFDDVVRVGLYLTDLGQFGDVNAVMAEYFDSPYPARSTVEVSALPKGARFEVDAVMVLR